MILHPLAHEYNTQLRNVLGGLPIGGVSSSVLSFIHIAIHGMKLLGHLLYPKSQNLKGLDAWMKDSKVYWLWKSAFVGQLWCDWPISISVAIREHGELL